MSGRSRLSIVLAVIASVTFVLAVASIIVILGFLPADELGLIPAFAD